MKDKGILKKLREINSCLYDGHMNIRVEPIGEISEMGLGKIRIKLLVDILDIIANTAIVNTETKIYIFNNVTKKKVNEVIKAMTENPNISFNTTQSKIHYGKVKLDETIGSLVDDLLDKDTNESELMARVGRMYNEYSTNVIADDIKLNLDRAIYNSELSDGEFERLLGLIRPYFKSEIDKVMGQLTDDMVGYVNYLGTSKYTNNKDIERLNQLKCLMEAVEDGNGQFDIDD